MTRATACRFGSTATERRRLARLDRPERIQAFLDRIPYSTDHFYRSPRRVLRDRRAHCFDGALFAAAALQRAGFPPQVVDLRAVRDDDHVIAVFRHDRHLGAVAKSNMSGLRWREPIHRSLRELVLSYFDDYFSVEGRRTLRSYSPPLDLRTMPFDWTTCDERLDEVATKLDALPHRPILTPAMARRLLPVDRRSFDAGMLGAADAGLYHPPR
ncbi:MAG: hypothetical protein JXB32_24175 [Deltaproteobacteria bacterium]|nr:hypothetical protein [Deltaproteobacteria bacterium]